MARIVGKRSGPPYLLVVFVILFLMATAVAVLMYLNSDKTEQLAAERAQTLKKLAGDIARDEKLQAMLKEVEKNAQENPSQTHSVLGNMQSQIADLTQAITGASTSAEEAKSAAESAFKRMDVKQGLATEVKQLRDRLEAKDQELKDKDKQTEALKTEKNQVAEQNSAMAAKQKTELEKLGKEITGLRDQLDTSQKKFEKDLTAARDEAKKGEVERDAKIAEKNTEIQRFTKLIEVKDNLIAKLQEELGKSVTHTKNPEDIPPKPVGKIMKVVESAKLCYVNIGADQQVTPGLTFVVYPEGGVGTGDPNGKARIEVSNVGKSTSECQITRQKDSDPVVAGDVIVNVAFSTGRSQAFVVEGLFDLYNDGRATERGAEEVRNMITRFGGKIAKELDFRTDYLVLGEEPSTPPKPKTGTADESGNKLYEKAMQDCDHYKAVRQAATTMKIPILNTARFLALVGQAGVSSGK